MTTTTQEPSYLDKLSTGPYLELFKSLNNLTAEEHADLITDIVHRIEREGMHPYLTSSYYTRDADPLELTIVQAIRRGLDEDTLGNIRDAQAICLDRAYQYRIHDQVEDQWNDNTIYEVFTSIQSFGRETPAWDFWHDKGDLFLNLLDVLEPSDDEKIHPYFETLGMISYLELKPELEFWTEVIKTSPAHSGLAIRTVMEQVSAYEAIDLLPMVEWTDRTVTYAYPIVFTNLVERANEDPELMIRLEEAIEALPEVASGALTRIISAAEKVE